MAVKHPKIPASEGYLIEFKSFSGGLSTKELATTLCAFANTDGGEIFIGVTDQGEARGLNISPQLLDAVQNAAREGCVPPVPIKLERFRITNDREVLRVSTPKSPRLHTTASGQTYIRVGSQDKRVLGDELLRLAESKSEVSFEDSLLDAGLEVLDLHAIEQYYKARRTVSPIRSNLQPQDLLLKMGLAQNGHLFRIKAGAFILFGKEEDDVLLQRDFTFVKYEAAREMYVFREDVRLPATQMLNRLMELIRPYNLRTEGIKGITRQDLRHYPEEAIREALLNAFAHRDYRIRGLRNECRVHPDRVEFVSVGGLPSFITLDNMEERHYSRNPKIMHALLILGFVEQLGQGITLMKNALKQNGNPAPEFSASPEQFKVVFRRAAAVHEEKDIQTLLNHYFQSERWISRRQLESLLGLSSTSAKKIMRQLLDVGFLERCGSGPQTRYRMKQ